MIDSLMAIDPGTTRSAWVKFVRGVPTSYGLDDNPTALRKVGAYIGPGAQVVCEQIESYGMAVGREVFETVRWAGRFEQAFLGLNGSPAHACWHYLPRRAVKLEICGQPRAKDANIRQALIDLYGGKDKAIGKKAAPGPLYGMAGDVWAALAVGITFIRQQQHRSAAA
jgi:hypothetical protein